ncbi:hypothetical protein BD560DRAFT_380153 [Blakeslea trispora]|nr:hypothetical protein BD560DRAFT_380148 [Blakeslea trispora]KAI8390177.1 hypothetical protein BD560DRAFT_380153 [Blakeslea trispora]
MKNRNETSASPKVGRQRIYTNEQRKERNRKAQAAFRLRRDKYTKALEDTMLQLKTSLGKLEEKNLELAERVQQAEQRYSELNTQMMLIQSLLHPISTDNLVEQTLANISKIVYFVESV